MIALPTVPPPVRRPLFYSIALLDIALRVWSATMQAEYLSYTSGVHSASEFASIAQGSGVSVPIFAIPLVLSPLAYLLGQLLVVLESRYVRFVALLFVIASFVVYTPAPWMSVLATVLAYLILLSGTIQSRATVPRPSCR